MPGDESIPLSDGLPGGDPGEPFFGHKNGFPREKGVSMENRVIQLLIDSFGQILVPGLTMTIPLTIISFSLGMVIATITALVQFANIRVLK